MTHRVALQGRPGAYSHLAANSLYPNCDAVFCDCFEDVFSAVEKGDVDFGVIPVENSTAGRVSDVHPLLDETSLHVIGELFLPIRHCLIGLPEAEVDDVTEAYSHIQGLMQCDGSLKARGIQPKQFGDTAGAAEWLKENGSAHQSAIASSLAADVYGLKILQHDLQDTEHNTTRFLVFSKEGVIEPFAPEKKFITTLIFKVRNIPSALYKALGGFATNGVNITKLESYIDENGGMHSAKFYVDIEAHADERRMQNAMEELAFFSDDVKVLGTSVRTRS